MKPIPNNWNELSYDDKYRHIVGESTGVCHCNPSLEESCEKCVDLPDLKLEDRNYYNEALIITRHYRNISHIHGDQYGLYYDFLSLDDEENFNTNFKMYFIEGTDNFDQNFYDYMKSIRQADYYFHLRILNTNVDKNDDKRIISSGHLDSMLHTFLNSTNVVEVIFKKILLL